MKLVRQRKKKDCGIAAFASYLGIEYEDAYVEIAKVDPARGRSGLTQRQLMKAAARLGHTLVQVRKPDLKNDRGILTVHWHDAKEVGAHFVVLGGGQIWDVQDGVTLPVDEYLASIPNGEVGWLLRESE